MTTPVQDNTFHKADALLNVGEVAARLRVHKSWVYEHADDLGAYRLGKYLRFDWSRVVAHMEVGSPNQRPILNHTKQSF